MSDFDPSRYGQAPQFNVASGLALARSLLEAAPSKPQKSISKAISKLEEAREQLQQAWQKIAPSASSKVSAKEADRQLDRSWALFHNRLQAYSELPSERYPDAERAGELLLILFPDGLKFLRLPYREEWAESEKRLQQIENEHLAKDLNKLCGKEFLSEVEQMHQVYGGVLGVTKVQSTPSPSVSLLEPLRQLSQAIGSYSRKVAALVDEDDPTSIEEAKQALLPIDVLRAKPNSRAKSVPTEAAEPVAEPTTDSPSL
jgi:hypothetical protein